MRPAYREHLGVVGNMQKSENLLKSIGYKSGGGGNLIEAFTRENVVFNAKYPSKSAPN